MAFASRLAEQDLLWVLTAAFLASKCRDSSEFDLERLKSNHHKEYIRLTASEQILKFTYDLYIKLALYIQINKV